MISRAAHLARYSNENVLVVGGTGFIGRHLAIHLQDLGARVSVLGLNTQSGAARTRTRCLIADIAEPGRLADAIGEERFSYVFNLAGYIDHAPFQRGGKEMIDIHLIGTINLIQQLNHSGLRGFVQVGSSDEYGNSSSPQKETMREAPISPYSAAKAGATHVVQMLARTEGLPGVVTRLFLTYGPGQDKRRFLPQVISGCLEDNEFPTSSGIQIRDFCFVQDTVEALAIAAVTPEAIGEVINVASGLPVTVRDMIEKVRELIGRGRPMFDKLPYRPNENMSLWADIRKARRLLGWTPQVPLERGLEVTIESYRIAGGCGSK